VTQPAQSQHFDRIFQALADPHRRDLVERLASGPASVSELAEPASVGLPAVLKHLRVLEAGGIVVSRKTGRVRTYSMRPEAFASIADWIEQRRATMNSAFDRLAVAMSETPEQDST
jgi:DNA-binding transcriptional ArsR family regulator